MHFLKTYCRMLDVNNRYSQCPKYMPIRTDCNVLLFDIADRYELRKIKTYFIFLGVILY